MNILLISNGSRGDINPFISIGVSLKERGHCVTLISIELYRQITLDAGLHFIAYGTNDGYFKAIHHPDTYSQSLRRSFCVLADWFCIEPMRPVYQIISTFDPKSTLLIAPHYMFGARLANEKLNFPLITACLQPFSFWSIEKPPRGLHGKSAENLPFFLRKLTYHIVDKRLIDPHLSGPVNTFRKELGLEERTGILSQWCYSPDKNIGLFPEWFATPAQDWPPNTQIMGFVHCDEEEKHPLPSALLHFLTSGDPVVILTYGTSMTKGHLFFKHSINAVRKLGYRCLVLTPYADQLPPLITEYERQIDYTPLKPILPYAAAIIHGGGIGTIAEALAAGVPQLTVPFINDQPDNAARLERLGVSLNISINDYSDSYALNCLTALLNSSEIKLNCQQYAKKIDFKKTAIDVCELIENTRGLLHEQ